MSAESVFKKIKNVDKKLLIQLVVVFIFPLILCIVICAFRGLNFFKLYIPYSKDNDSLFYYKLVEGVLSPGGIKGYYGFNENHAQIGSFAAWNPVIVLPWIVFGRLFGWNSFSPILYNVIFFSISLTAFVGLAKLNIKQTACLLVGLALYPPLPLHLMNMLPEANVASFILLDFACVFAYINSKKRGFLATSLGFCIYLTMCRPYYFLLFVITFYYYAKSKMKNWWMLPIASMVVAVGAYLLTTKYFTAEYFEPLFSYPYMDFIKRGEIRWALSNTYHTMLDTARSIYDYVRGGIMYGGLPSVQYAIAMLMSILLLIASISKKNKEKSAVYWGMGLNYICVFMAILILLRKANEGARHSFVFSLIALILLFTVEFDVRGAIRHLLIFAVLIFLATKGTYQLRSYDLSNVCAVPQDEIEALEAELKDSLVISDSGDKYENTIAWVLVDYSGDNYMITDYHSLFAVPGAMGLNICSYDYIVGNIDCLKSGYLAVPPGGDIDELSQERNFTEIARTANILIYKVDY